jgi:hypothetical protein
MLIASIKAVALESHDCDAGMGVRVTGMRASGRPVDIPFPFGLVSAVPRNGCALRFAVEPSAQDFANRRTSF